jgi:hypothetical protein
VSQSVYRVRVPAAMAGDGFAPGHGPMEFLLTIANVLYVFAYFVRKTLWLRALSLAGTSCLLAYFLTLPVPLMQAVYWNTLYAVINVVWIGRVLLRPAR